MIKHTELRCGNLHEYYIEDKHDERKAWWEVSVIDWNDLRYLEEHPEDNFYRFIPLSEEWLIRAGFEKYSDKEFYIYTSKENEVRFYKSDSDWNLAYFITETRYVHQLQNLYFWLTGEELTFKDL